MKFYFCEKCGERLTERDLAAGQAKDKALRGVYCASCAEGVMTMESVPLTESSAKEVLQQQRASAQTIPAAVRTCSSATIRPAGARSSKRMVREPREPHRSPRRTQPTVWPYLMIGAGLFLALADGWMLLSKSSPPDNALPSIPPLDHEATTARVPAIPAEPKAPASETPLEVRADLSAASGKEPVSEPKATEPEVPQEAPAEKVESPKERFERLVREGKINPEVPEPAPEPVLHAPSAESASTPVPLTLGRPANSKIWMNFKSKTHTKWPKDSQRIEIDGNGMLKLPGDKAHEFWRGYATNKNTVIRIHLYASPDNQGGQLLAWDKEQSDNARTQLKDLIKPSQWTVVKVRIKDLWFWDKSRSNPAGHSFGSITLHPKGGYWLIDSMGVYDEE